MTKEEKQNLHLFETRVRQLIMKYKELEQEVSDLKAANAEQALLIKQLEADNAQWQKQYKDLKVARMIDVTSQDCEGAQKRLSKLIREIDKCIALINL